ncbi:MAG: CPBP family intramembrane glutamic endopeptidase [Pseudomonadota bacterium]
MRNAYRPYETLVAPARPTAALSRLAVGVVFTIILFYSLIFCLSAFLGVVFPGDTLARYDTTLRTGDSPVGVLANLYVFGLAAIALAISLRQIHARDVVSIIGDIKLAKTQFSRICLYLAGLHLFLNALLPTHPDAVPVSNMRVADWLLLLPLALPAVLVQTGTEELVFRGYLQSQLAARYANRIVWMSVPAIVFGFLHYDTATMGDNALLITAWATAFGLAAADLTARSGTLGPAVAMHFINNVAAILLIAPEGNFDGLALYTYPFGLDDTDAVWIWAPIDLMVLFLSWLTARLAIRR